MLLSDRLAAGVRRAGGPAGRGVLRLRRHADPRLLRRRLLPRPDPQREGRAARGDPHRCDWRCGAWRPRRTSRSSSPSGSAALDGHHRGRASRAGRAGVRQEARRLASTRRPGSSSQAHHRMGHTVVLASSATRFQLEAAARTLGIEHVLSTALEVGDDGILTGRADGPTLWRAGKARRRPRVRRRARHRPRGELRLLQRQRGHRLPQPGRAAPRATTPRTGLREHATAERLAGARLPQPRPARPAHHRPLGRRDGRHPDRHRHRRGARAAQRQPPHGHLVDHGPVVGVLPRPRRRARRHRRRAARVGAAARGVRVQPPEPARRAS